MTAAARVLPVPPTEGEELPPLEIPVTRTLIVSGALASRDFQDVHHDAEASRAKGSPDIFMNILTTNGLVGRYVTEWAGPGARLRKVAIRLGAPNYPGDTMTLTGRVVSVRAEGRTVEVAVTGANGLGNHVTGTVLLDIDPDSDPDSVPGSDPGSGPVPAPAWEGGAA